MGLCTRTLLCVSLTVWAIGLVSSPGLADDCPDWELVWVPYAESMDPAGYTEAEHRWNPLCCAGSSILPGHYSTFEREFHTWQLDAACDCVDTFDHDVEPDGTAHFESTTIKCNECLTHMYWVTNFCWWGYEYQCTNPDPGHCEGAEACPAKNCEDLDTAITTAAAGPCT